VLWYVCRSEPIDDMTRHFSRFQCIYLFLTLGLNAAQAMSKNRCDPKLADVACSTNPLCKCQPTRDGQGVCRVNITCSSASSCGDDRSCPESGMHCRTHGPCGNRPICYPNSPLPQFHCPPLSTKSPLLRKRRVAWVEEVVLTKAPCNRPTGFGTASAGGSGEPTTTTQMPG
jgi:hypothetical protein